MAAPIRSLFDAPRQLDDPRKARGVRHPYPSPLARTFLGLLGRQTDLASLQRGAKDPWPTRKGPLGFTRKRPPHATTIRRAAAKFSLGQFRVAFARWVTSLPRAPGAVTVAGDGKTRKPGHDPHGDPVPRLNVFAPELNLCRAQSPVTGGPPTEPQAMKHGPKEWLDHHPFLRLFPADAAFTQRPLARVILEADRDSLVAVKDNQPDRLEAILTRLGDVVGREPDAKAVEKKGTNCTPGGSGWSKATRSPTPAKRPGSLASR